MKPNLIVLHGAIGSEEQLRPLLNKLEEDFKVYSFSFHGHGGDKILEDFSIELFSKQLHEFIEDHEFKNVNVFGYSMGGYVATHLALHTHGLINKIFCLATKWTWSPEISAKEIKILNVDLIAEKVPAFAKVLEERHHPADWKEVLNHTSKMMTAMGDINPIDTNKHHDIKTTIRFAIGDNDKMVSLEETVAMRNNFKHSSLLVLPDTPHPIEQVDLGIIGFEAKAFFTN